MLRLFAVTIWLIPAASFAQELRVGTVNFANSGSAAAQKDFQFAVAQLHNFEYGSAAVAFRRAQELDPDFALAYWGEAMTYNHAVWQEQNREAALEVMRRWGATPDERAARCRTERERDIWATLEILYGPGDKKDRDDVYARAMEELHASYPDEVDIAAFTALAILGTAHEGRDFATYMRSAAILEEAFDKAPRHPGLAHYLIHSYDDPIHAPLGLRAARVYSEIAPDAGHAQHMCSHIFVAAGMWDEVVKANVNALDAVARAAARAGRTVPHCGHYTTWLNYGYLQIGEPEKAAELTAACYADAAPAATSNSAFDPDNSRQASFITMWARYLFDTEDFDSDVAALKLDLSPTQVQERMTVAYVKALESALAGNAAGVREQLGIVRDTRGATERLDADSDAHFGLEARGRSEVIEHQVQALLARAEGDMDGAVAHARAAAVREEAMPFMFGPPFVDKPSYELLGEILLAAGDREEATDAFRKSLARTPNRVRSVDGLEMALRR